MKRKTKRKQYKQLIRLLLFLFAMWLVLPRYETVSADLSGSIPETQQLETIDQSYIPKPEKYFPDELPADFGEKQDMIYDYLLTLTDADTASALLWLAKDESKYDQYATPIAWVIHCERPNGSFYGVELEARDGGLYQADCALGDVEVHREKSLGLLQILPSTARDHGCDGDLYDWKSNLECGVRVSSSGYWQWTTNKNYHF